MEPENRVLNPIKDSEEEQMVVKTGRQSHHNKKTLQDYVYHVGSAKQANDVIDTKYLLNHICKTYTFGDDIANVLKIQMAMDFTSIMPKLQRSIKKDKEHEVHQFQML